MGEINDGDRYQFDFSLCVECLTDESYHYEDKTITEYYDARPE